MTASHEESAGKNLYFIDHESGAEMARLLDQDRLYTRGMGGFLSERSNDLTGFKHILDIGCGPGGWVQEIAFLYPEIEVEGIDISEQMIAYAQMQAKVQGLQNAHFRVMDMARPLDFADQCFDLVNGRLIAFLPTTAWPGFMGECVRITRRGGIIRLTETELSVTTSAALDHLDSLLKAGLRAAGQSFSPEGRHVGIIAMHAHFLHQAGCTNIGRKAHVLDYSAGTDYHQGFYDDWKVFFKLMQPFLIATQVTTQEEVDRLYEQMLIDMMQEDFCAVYLLVTTWGEKPTEP